MFTGIIEQQGEVVANRQQQQGHLLKLFCRYERLVAGESIAVNGVCLTLKTEHAEELSFDLSPETLAKTQLKHLKAGNQVNLERAMKVGDRFGGHYVSGHVDTTAWVEEMTELTDYLRVVISGFKPEHRKFLLSKASITVNGVSLTINHVENDRIHLTLVPHTLLLTNLSQLCPGVEVNIEFDYLTRIMAHQLQIMKPYQNEDSIS